MQIIFQNLTVVNFKSHRDITVNFGERTDITGDNAKGKTSITEAIPWLLYGIDVLGSKLDPTPITYAAEETKVSLLLKVNDNDLLLGRGLKKNKTTYYVNDVPSKAGEFTEVLEALFDKDLFLSLYNPNYFPSMHWEKQRTLLLQYVTSPVNKEVLKYLPDEQSKSLSVLFKKHSLEDIKKIHAENKTSLDKKYIAAQSRTKTLKEQLDQIKTPNVPIESLKVELAQIDKQVREIEKEMDSAQEKNKEYNSIQSKIRFLQDQIDMSKERWPALKNELIEDTCKTCKRPLDEESVEAVKADKESRKDQYQTNHKSLIKQRDELKSQLKGLEFIDVSLLREKLHNDDKGQPLREAIRNFSNFESLKEQVDQAEADEKETLESLNDSIFILDSVKAFKAKESELQAEKVQALFETLSVRLFEEQKNGEMKSTFEIELDKKPYRKLSLSEGIRAGLELRDVLSQQSELITPVFVDNAESITSFKQPVGQLIVSRVVAGQELKIDGMAAK